MKRKALPFICIFIITCATASYVSQVNVPDLDAAHYKQVDSKGKIVGLYFYHSKFPTAEGDMTMKAIMNAMSGKVDFYKINVKGFSLEDQQYLAQKVIGGMVLPSYVFVNNGKIVLRVRGGKSSKDDAQAMATSLYQGFESRNWMQEKKNRR